MKIGGVDPKTVPNVEILVLPRGENNIVFRAQGLPNLDDFHQRVPQPTPPMLQTAEGVKANVDDPGFKATLAEYNVRRLAYFVVHSLKDIEWDTVNPEVPGTWANWEADLKKNGFTQIECNHVFNLVMQANALDDAKLKKARENFLRGLHPVATS